MNQSDKDREETFKIHPVYSFKTRIGEWHTQLALHEHQAKFAAYKKKHCQLLVAKTRAMFRKILEPVTLSTAIDSLAYNNIYQIVASELPNSVSMKSAKGKGLYLSGLMNDKDIDQDTDFTHGCFMSASPDKAPCRRNCFFFSSPNNKQGNVLYGEDLFIQIIRRSGDLPLYLQCEMSTLDTFGDKQYVRLSRFPDIYCHFMLLHWNPNKRKESLGSAVAPNNHVIIRQLASGKNLAAEISNWMPTFFGIECAVSCHVYRNANKMETGENIWKVLGRTEPDKGMMIRAAKGEDIPEEFLEE